MPRSNSVTTPGLQRAMRELAAVQQALKQARRAAQTCQWKQKHREEQRWEEMMSFGVLVLALVKQPELPWAPALIQRFELTADAEEVDEKLCEHS